MDQGGVTEWIQRVERWWSAWVASECALLACAQRLDDLTEHPRVLASVPAFLLWVQRKAATLAPDAAQRAPAVRRVLAVLLPLPAHAPRAASSAREADAEDSDDDVGSDPRVVEEEEEEEGKGQTCTGGELAEGGLLLALLVCGQLLRQQEHGAIAAAPWRDAVHAFLRARATAVRAPSAAVVEMLRAVDAWRTRALLPAEVAADIARRVQRALGLGGSAVSAVSGAPWAEMERELERRRAEQKRVRLEERLRPVGSDSLHDFRVAWAAASGRPTERTGVPGRREDLRRGVRLSSHFSNTAAYLLDPRPWPLRPCRLLAIAEQTKRRSS